MKMTIEADALTMWCPFVRFNACRELSEELSVSNETIRSARVGLTWKHIKRRR